MIFTRRQTLQLGLTGLAAFGVTTIMPFSARAQDAAGDSYETENGEITIFPIEHASFVMTVPDIVIYVDPVGGAGAYEGHPPADLILVTHEHGDHFDAETLSALAGDQTRLLTNPSVFEKLPDDLKAKAAALANGEETTVGDLGIEAIPAYNTTPERQQYHPEGRDNGYILTVDGRRVYIAGDTEDTPEMRALSDIYIAFVPMNLPYTMSVDQAASAVVEFAPQYVYPYHYQGSDIQAFAQKVAEAEEDIEVVQGPWYG
ncbi:MBL fold metallo-hydrolase [Chelativorans sp. AA-79]|uniref:MBL fold metallo-hydrolase n=1 Tax=Chelativorans sp. AA-79 TaxID=3028735 RepID=UPI0023F9A771|nr:MBL fold metallo-hydrolase [Chelativorans sp. AA-79]WEX10501.1 MBL fold metallo-hydrolase [Chelativorans sp. AA-79]